MVTTATATAAATAAAEDETEVCCLLCTERCTSKTRVKRPCCGNSTCQSCLHKHIITIFEEGRTGGRRKLNCPAGCSAALTDLEIRECFRRQHTSILWNFVGQCLYYTLGGWWVSARPYLIESCRHHRMWWQYLHTEAERQDLLQYEEWNKATAFAELTKTHDEVILHCPAANCDYAWLVADPARRRAKCAHENQNFYLWYVPMKPEEVPPNWVEPDFLNLEVTGLIPEDVEDRSSQRDGRRMVCGKCGHVFCGLCRNPWTYEKFSHSCLACKRYARRLPADWDNQDIASWRNTRGCPGCRMRTSRIAGCNHMTCPCGKEWCYVCGVEWNPTHYSCRDTRGRATADECIIL